MAFFSELKEFHDRYLDPALLMKMFFTKDSPFPDDTSNRIFPLLCKTFSSGVVKGELLIAMSIVPFFQWALPACQYFSDIILSCSTDKCISEVEKWRTNAPGAMDWSQAAKMICEIEGNGESWIEKQIMLQKKIKQVPKYNLSKSNPLSPTVLPQADCLILPNCLECHMMDEGGFCCALKNCSTLLKKGGHLILIMGSEETFYMVGSCKFPHLSMDEGFVRRALGEADYDIEELHVLPRHTELLNSVSDYRGYFYVNARKK
ncbi:indolethylamine N-methyltransferase-like [Lissotriton helveticus]